MIDRDAATRELAGFEVTWQAGARSFLVTWDRDRGLRTGWIDTGDCIAGPRHKQSVVVGFDVSPRGDRIDAARAVAARIDDEAERRDVLARVSVG